MTKECKCKKYDMVHIIIHVYMKKKNVFCKSTYCIHICIIILITLYSVYVHVYTCMIIILYCV